MLSLEWVSDVRWMATYDNRTTFAIVEQQTCKNIGTTNTKSLAGHFKNDPQFHHQAEQMMRYVTTTTINLIYHHQLEPHLNGVLLAQVSAAKPAGKPDAGDGRH